MTTALKHTLGPWKADTNRLNSESSDDKYCGIVGGGVEEIDDWIIAEVCGDVPQHKANARLIAAAPELLDALKSLVQVHGSLYSGDHTSYSLLKAEAAIQKATGG
jgi:hypothetical protein